jgi:hypothetical protein
MAGERGNRPPLAAGAGVAGAQEAASEPPASNQVSLPERIERAARTFSASLGRMGLYPHVTSLATGGGGAPGLSYFDPAAGPRRTGLYGSVSHSMKGDSL